MNIRITGALLGFALAMATPVFADETAPEAGKPEAAAHEDWVADFDKALAQAKAEKKDLLVDFTGSDWCGWCIRLKKEVFDHAAFLDAAKKDYVLVALDFDNRGQAKATNPNPARDNELKMTYAAFIGGFPTILLISPDREVYASTGYRPGGAEKYVPHIAQLKKDGPAALATAKALVAELVAATDENRTALQEKAVALLAGCNSSMSASRLVAGTAKQAFDADADNKSGLRLRAATAMLKSGTADKSVLESFTTLDAKNELGLLEQAIFAKTGTLRSAAEAKAVYAEIDALFAAGGPKDAEMRKQLAIRGMSLASNPNVLNDQEKAKEWALRVRECGYGEGEEKLKEHIDKLLGDAPADGAK